MDVLRVEGLVFAVTVVVVLVAEGVDVLRFEGLVFAVTVVVVLVVVTILGVDELEVFRAALVDELLVVRVMLDMEGDD